MHTCTHSATLEFTLVHAYKSPTCTHTNLASVASKKRLYVGYDHTKWQAKQIIDVISAYHLTNESTTPGIKELCHKGHELLFLKTFVKFGHYAPTTPDVHKMAACHRPHPIEIEQASLTHPLIAGKPKKRRPHIKD